MTMDRCFVTITVMQTDMLHTHEAVQAGEGGGSDEQLVCGQFECKTRYPPEAVLTV